MVDEGTDGGITGSVTVIAPEEFVPDEVTGLGALRHRAPIAKCGEGSDTARELQVVSSNARRSPS
jgi:hypothetical protein